MLLGYSYGKAFERLKVSGGQKLYSVPREQVPCRVCRYQWIPGKLPLRYIYAKIRSQVWSHRLWPGLPVVAMAQEKGIEPNACLNLFFVWSFSQVYPIFFPPPLKEMRLTSLGRQWKNKRHLLKAGGTRPGRGTSQRLVFGILSPSGKAWAQVVPDVEAKTLFPWIWRRLEVGSSVCSNSWMSNTGIATKD